MIIKGILSTNLSIDDHNLFLTSNKVDRYGLIKQEGTSESLRHILNQLHNNLIYPILEEDQQEKKA
jgi:hypothetical protein